MSVSARPAGFPQPHGFDLLGGLLVNVRMQHPHERQIAKTLREVQSVADHEEVGDFKPHIVRFHRLDAPRRLVQQHARLDPARFESLELAQHTVERFSRVENVIHQQHIAPAHVEPQFFGKDEVPGFGARAVAGDADEVQPQGEREVPNQIGQEHHRPVEQRDDHRLTPGEVSNNVAGHGPDAPRDLVVGDQDALDLPAPTRGDAGGGIELDLGNRCFHGWRMLRRSEGFRGWYSEGSS